MTFEEFVQLAHESRVEELHVESLEGDIFLYCAYVEGEKHVLMDKNGVPLHPQSLGHARKWLIDAGGLEDVPLFLVQETPYDEMIGLDSNSESHKTPMTLHSGL
ncbi:hypothetical protein BTW08_13345 [Salinicola sp. MH3R3-1]|uniref:DUF6482 family protein n=1 Tax=Salinicola TaxID=404432 RepID=UPI00094E204B|nr:MULTISPECIES: DUF6482 family protein [Salinicola]OLO07232.1 hypothetical protein BTW08_13345 [Salinicola sp. MH3R3-1]